MTSDLCSRFDAVWRIYMVPHSERDSHAEISEGVSYVLVFTGGVTGASWPPLDDLLLSRA